MKTLTVDDPLELAEAQLSSAVMAYVANEHFGHSDVSAQRALRRQASQAMERILQAKGPDYAADSLIDAKRDAEDAYAIDRRIEVQHCGRPSQTPPRAWEK